VRPSTAVYIMITEDLSMTTPIDWSQPQPEGTYRCERGWESGGYQWGCLERATTTAEDDRLLCTEHALIDELQNIRQALNDEGDRVERQSDDGQAIMQDIADALMVLSWRARPWWARVWFLARRRSEQRRLRHNRELGQNRTTRMDWHRMRDGD
jgi:hypothetical protein